MSKHLVDVYGDLPAVELYEEDCDHEPPCEKPPLALTTDEYELIRVALNEKCEINAAAGWPVGDIEKLIEKVDPYALPRIAAPDGFAIEENDDGSLFLSHRACRQAIMDVQDVEGQADLNAWAANHECKEA